MQGHPRDQSELSVREVFVFDSTLSLPKVLVNEFFHYRKSLKFRGSDYMQIIIQDRFINKILACLFAFVMSEQNKLIREFIN